MRFYRIFALAIILIILVSLSPTPSFAGYPVPGSYGPDTEDIGNRSMDFTVYRTVNTLSCHPQNKMLGSIPNYFPIKEIPLMIAFKSNTYCYAVHFADAPEWNGVPPDLSANPTGRPKIPWRHYMVVETLNPDYGKSGTKFSGKYIHWEGRVLNFQTSNTLGLYETWHFKKSAFGGIGGQGGATQVESAFDTVSYTFTDNNGHSSTQKGIKISSQHPQLDFSTCVGTAQRRPGDENIPCTRLTVDVSNDSSIPNHLVAWNPTHYTDIPHNKYGNGLGDTTSWVKCLNELPTDYYTYDETTGKGFGNTTPPPVFPAIASDGHCDYPPLIGNPSAHPTCLNSSQFTASTPIPTSMENCATSSPTIPPTATPTQTPTISQTSPTPFYLRSDFGGLGGQKDGKIDIQDFNILASEFYLTGPNLSADIIKDSNNRVDIQDYNAFVNDYLAYLVR